MRFIRARLEPGRPASVPRALGLALLLALAACGAADGRPFDLVDGPTLDGGSSPVAGAVVANAGRDQLVSPGAEATLDAAASFSTEGGALTYLWSQVDGPSVTLSNPAGARTRLRAPADATRLAFLLTVSDGVRQATDHVQIVVRGDGGHAPFAIAGPDLEVAPGAAFTLDGSQSFDPDGDALTFSWRMIHDGAADPPFATEARVGLDAPGTPQILVLRLEAHDGLLTASDDLVVRVVANPSALAPTLTTRVPSEVDPGAHVSLRATAASRDGAPVRLGWRQVGGPPLDIVLDGTSATFDAPDRVTELAFLATAFGPTLAGAPHPVLVHVTAGPGNSAPMARIAPIVDALPAGPVELDGSASFDPDGDPLTAFLWVQLSGPAVSPADPAAPLLSFVAPAAESVLTFSLSVRDEVVWSEPALVQVHVAPAP